MKYLTCFIALFLVISCQKEDHETRKSNTDEVLRFLDSQHFLRITPNTERVIELYSEFVIQSDTQLVYHTIARASGGWSTLERQVIANIESVQIIDEKKQTIPYTLERGENYIQIKPLQAFSVKSTFKMIIDYSYHEARGLKLFNEIQRTKEFLYNTTESNQLNISMVYCEYPLERQYNFLQEEYEFGFIKTFVKPDFLLHEKLKVIITNIGTNEEFEKQIIFDESLGILKYEMPQLENNSIYRIDYLRDKNKELLRSNYFKTSSYNRFTEKIEHVFEGENKYYSRQIRPGMNMLIVNGFNGFNELFDYYEQVLPETPFSYYEFGKYDYPKVVSVEIDTLRFDINDLGYNLAQSLGYKLNRPTENGRYKPIRDFGFFKNVNKGSNSAYQNILLTDNEIKSKSPNSFNVDAYEFTTYLPMIIINDWYQFSNRATNAKIADSSDPRLQSLSDIFEKEHKLYESYPYKMRYIIPGINIITFEGNYEIIPRGY